MPKYRLLLIHKIANKIIDSVHEETLSHKEYQNLAKLFRKQAKRRPPWLAKRYREYAKLINRIALDEKQHASWLKWISDTLVY